MILDCTNFRTTNRTSTTIRTSHYLRIGRPISHETFPVAANFCCVIMGRTGAGKTSLGNLVCGTSWTATAGSNSITTNLQRQMVNCGQNSFMLIDTPGTDSKVDSVKHALLLKHALTCCPLNAVFVVIRYQPRYDTMLEEFFEQQQPIQKYEDMTVVLISHWDIVENDAELNPNQVFDAIWNLFQDSCANLMCYSNRTYSNEVVSNGMFGCMRDMKPQTLKVSEEDFFIKFNVYQIKTGMMRSFKIYQEEARKVVNEFNTLVEQTCSAGSDKDAILHLLIVELRNELNKLDEKFIKQHQGEMVDIEYYALKIKLQKENIKICDNFVEVVQPMMTYNLMDTGDPRNLIKRCPKCQEIWFKTEGCMGNTSCGNRSFSSYWDQIPNPLPNFSLVRENGKLAWKKNKSKERNALPTRPQRSGSAVGCGVTFKWSDLPAIEPELILELFKVKTIEEAIAITRQSNFKRARQDYERNLDYTFYS